MAAAQDYKNILDIDARAQGLLAKDWNGKSGEYYINIIIILFSPSFLVAF